VAEVGGGVGGFLSFPAHPQTSGSRFPVMLPR
jgi:hypothetical protein